ncbi:MAG: LacI family DNA-binding transcriptional regulator [Burkholderiaceae bacterium]|nr:LacI family DNA-binding transcriptional regulator [Microbacteriaceae bacterium]
MANITDVAKLAGVSHQTVSRVLNDVGTVRPETRARVDAAIRELNYRPSAAARALVRGRSRTLGLIATGAPLYGPSSTMLAFNEAARAAGYRVSMASMASVDLGAMVDAIDVLLGQDVEALVVIVADVAAFDALAGLRVDIPLVAAESSGRQGLFSVSIDQYAGARLAVRHLVGLGHRRILHVAGPRGSVDAAERVRGWRAELDSAGLPGSPPVVGTWLARSGFEIGELLADDGSLGKEGATAVFCANDQMAIGLLHALHLAGIRVPEDVSVVGFDDIPEAAHFRPPLTTVRQDFHDLGSRLMATVLAALGGGVVENPAQTTPGLVERASTAPPPGYAARSVTEP